MNKNQNKFNGWTNYETWALALEYFSDPALIMECLTIDAEDAVFSFASDLENKVTGIHEWTLQKELASKLESWMDGYLDSLWIELEYDEGDRLRADKLRELIEHGNTWEIALTNCEEHDVVELLLETVEDCTEYLDPKTKVRILANLD